MRTHDVSGDMPALACDSHCHVFGPASRFPFDPQRRYTPDDAGFDMLRALHRRLGLQRGVLVQPNAHGHDHAAILHALAHGAGRYRAVGLLPADIPMRTLRELDQAGMRAVRYNFVSHLADATLADVCAMAERIAPLRWHICIHADDASLPGLLPDLAALPVPCVIDHMGRVDAAKGLAGAAFRALLSAGRASGIWVKISGVDRLAGGRPPYSDGMPFVRALLQEMPERILWGTDWPHPNVAGPTPDDAALLALFFDLCPDPALRERILVHNPQTLYRFNNIETAA